MQLMLAKQQFDLVKNPANGKFFLMSISKLKRVVANGCRDHLLLE